MLYYDYPNSTITTNTTQAYATSTMSPGQNQRTVLVVGNYPPPTDTLALRIADFEKSLIKWERTQKIKNIKAAEGVLWAQYNLETKPTLKEAPQHEPQRLGFSKRRSAKAVRNWRRPQ